MTPSSAMKKVPCMTHQIGQTDYALWKDFPYPSPPKPQCTSLEDIFILQPSMAASDVGTGESDFSRGTFTVYSPVVQMQDPEYGKGGRIVSFPNKLEIFKAT